MLLRRGKYYINGLGDKMEEERSLRYRVNVSTSVKGIKTWDCTVD
ncbi:hypothetical protein LCGC14_1561880, partial [marine sediment metagenome]